MTELTRRTLLTATALITVSAIAACTAPDSQNPRTSTAQTPEGTPNMMPRATPSTGSGTLLVFFSRAGENYWNGGRRNLTVGNTKRLAGMITDRISCDTYEILAADPYPNAYEPTVERNVHEQNGNARPAISGSLPDLSGYDAVLIGSPVWNVRAPMIMSTFIDSVDLTGKTVLPFVTYAVSGMAGIDQDYRDSLPGSMVSTGLAIRGEDVDGASADVDTWLRANKLLQHDAHEKGN